MNSKNILIICYSFPPNPGVGGRRWAKFAKYLSKNNYNVHVVSNFNTSQKISEWVKDVKLDDITIHEQQVFYPNIFNAVPKTVFEKFNYRFWLVFFKLFSKGSLYDKSFFWKHTVSKNVKKLIIDNEIKNVVVTGPPFRLLYFTALLKDELKNLNLIVDLRDPWTDNTSFFGFDTISPARMNFEKKMEKEVMLRANYVVSVNDYLTQIFKGKYPILKDKFITIFNGYDPDEIIVSDEVKNSKKDSIDFILTGSLYPDLEYVFLPFLKFLKNNEHSEFLKKVTFHFYGQIDYNLEKVIKQYDLSSVKLHGFQKMDLVKQKVAQSDFCMMFTSPNHASNFNTKFYEYISMKKPIIHFSNDGDITDVIVKNRLGFAVRPNSFNEDFEKVLNQIKSNDFNYNYDYDMKAFDIRHLTKEIEKLFI
jgi:glycosyltransferase involved in cell wall biosynthesis